MVSGIWRNPLSVLIASRIRFGLVHCHGCTVTVVIIGSHLRITEQPPGSHLPVPDLAGTPSTGCRGRPRHISITRYDPEANPNWEPLTTIGYDPEASPNWEPLTHTRTWSFPKFRENYVEICSVGRWGLKRGILEKSAV